VTSRKLLPLTIALVLIAIVLSSMSAPYRLVQAACVLGALTLVLQIPDTIEIVRALRERDERAAPPDKP
jgi:hypothetical protein